MRKRTVLYNECSQSFGAASGTIFRLAFSRCCFLARDQVIGLGRFVRQREYAMADHQKPYGKWTREELRSAEATARQFLQDNSSQIADTMRAKAKYLETLIQRVALPKTSFEDRLGVFRADLGDRRPDPGRRGWLLRPGVPARCRPDP